MISKSGTTTEPAIAFRVFRELLEKKYGKEEARKRIYCTTDRARGTFSPLWVCCPSLSAALISTL